MNKLIDVIDINEIFDEYDDDKNKINLIYKKANLSKIEISLFESYVLKYNSNYTKMATDLNSSKYITRKQINKILIKLKRINKDIILN